MYTWSEHNTVCQQYFNKIFFKSQKIKGKIKEETKN